MQASPSTLSCAALALRLFRSLPLMSVTSQSRRRERPQLSGGGFSNSELRMPNTAESHECRPSDVTADFRHCQVGSRQFRSIYFSASKSSIKRAQIFFIYIFQNHPDITVSLDALCFESGNSLNPVFNTFTFTRWRQLCPLASRAAWRATYSCCYYSAICSSLLPEDLFR